jgi:transcriptional regulator with GAF, ATPase, and Fis domain
MSDDGSKTVTVHAARARAPSTRFVEITSPGAPAVLRVREGVVRVGREADNQVVIDDPFVSRVHLEVRVFPNSVEVADMDTKNGTHYQGARIRELSVPGDATLVLGKQVALRVRVLDESKPVIDEDSEMVGQSSPIAKLRSAIQRVAPTNLTVLIEGETGTGKEVVARAIHGRSPRAQKNLVVFDCGAVSPTLVASELFGHTKGAYTGATGSTDGAFRRAHGGTLFLDEIGELPLDLQPALLRALEARQVKPVGGDAYVPVDVRVVAATNRALEADAEAGRFRKDLLFRLAVARIKVPPLRSRADDIGPLAQHFARQLGAQIAPSVLEALVPRQWPGNVRELRNTIERAVMMAGGAGTTVTSVDELDDDLESDEETDVGLNRLTLPGNLATIAPGALNLPQALPPGMSFQDAKQIAVDSFERDYLVRLFAEANCNLSEAARRSGVHRRYLRELFKKHGLDPAAMRANRK